MNKFKQLFIGILIGAFIFSAIPISAAVQQFILTKSDYKLFISGKEFTDKNLPILSYKGTTYAPLGKIMNLLGDIYTVDAKGKKISLSKTTPKPKIISTPTPKPAPSPYPSTIKDIQTDISNKVYRLGEESPIYNKQNKKIGSLKIISVTETTERNKYSQDKPVQVIVIEYEYRNTDGEEELYIHDASHFQVIDALGGIGKSYPNISAKGPTPVPKGSYCKATSHIGLENKSDSVKLNIKLNMFSDKVDIAFVLPIRSESNTSNTSQQEKVTENINNKDALKEYLESNFLELETCLGKTKFTFDILENNTTMFPEDYWIMVRYEYPFFDGAMLSNKYTNEQKATLRQQLKDFQEKLAKAVIEKTPNKKLYGGYYDSWYKYPNLKIDLQTRRYFSWTNYDVPDFLIKDKYSSTKPSTFRWDDFIDDKLDY